MAYSSRTLNPQTAITFAVSASALEGGVAAADDASKVVGAEMAQAADSSTAVSSDAAADVDVKVEFKTAASEEVTATADAADNAGEDQKEE